MTLQLPKISAFASLGAEARQAIAKVKDRSRIEGSRLCKEIPTQTGSQEVSSV
jgi:hypothetical protein